MVAAAAAAASTTRAAAASAVQQQTCRLDGYGAKDVDRFVASARKAMREAFGVTDAQITAWFSRAAGGVVPEKPPGPNLLGDVSRCRAVRVNRAIAIAQFAGLVAFVGVVGWMLAAGPRPLGFAALGYLGWASLALTAVQMRHLLSLTGKAAWYGFGSDARGTLALTVTTLAATTLMTGWGDDADDGWALRGLFLIVLLLTLARGWFALQDLLDPQATPLVALVAALDRVLSAKHVAGIRDLVTAG